MKMKNASPVIACVAIITCLFPLRVGDGRVDSSVRSLNIAPIREDVKPAGSSNARSDVLPSRPNILRDSLAERLDRFYTSADLSRYVDGLAASAYRGDGEAAFLTFWTMRHCEVISRTTGATRARFDENWAKWRQNGSGPGFVEAMRYDFERCANLLHATSDIETAAERWLQRSADAGNAMARYFLAGQDPEACESMRTLVSLSRDSSSQAGLMAALTLSMNHTKESQTALAQLAGIADAYCEAGVDCGLTGIPLRYLCGLHCQTDTLPAEIRLGIQNLGARARIPHIADQMSQALATGYGVASILGLDSNSIADCPR